MTQRYLRRATAAACLALASAGATAAEGQVSLEAGIGYSDNVTRSDGASVDETLGTIGLLFDLVRDEGRLTGSLVGDLQYITYLDNTFDDSLYGRVDLNGDYAITPSVFSWGLENTWGQARRDEFATPNSENQENINYLATGPDLRFRLGQRTFATVSGRYAMTTYEDTPRDYTSLGGDLAVVRELSASSNVGLAARAARVEYDESFVGSDYDVLEAAVTFNAEGVRTRVTAEAGITSLDDQTQTLDNPLFRLTLVRKVATASTLTINVGQEFSDAGRWFNASGGIAPGGPDAGSPSDVLSSGGAFDNRYVGIGWATDKIRTRFSAGLLFRQEDYAQNNGLDREVLEFNAEVSRRMTEALTVNARATLAREEFDDGSLDDDRLRLDAGLLWDITGRTYLRFSWEYFEDDASATTRTFSESRYWLRVGYRPR